MSKDIKALIESGKSAAQIVEAQQSGDKEAYKKFYDAKLKKYGVDSIDDLDDEKQKAFHNEIEKEWKADDEMNEASRQAIQRMGGLVSIKKERGFIQFGKAMIEELEDEGFEEDEVKEYLIYLVEKKI